MRWLRALSLKIISGVLKIQIYRIVKHNIENSSVLTIFVLAHISLSIRSSHAFSLCSLCFGSLYLGCVLSIFYNLDIHRQGLFFFFFSGCVHVCLCILSNCERVCVCSFAYESTLYA